MTAVTIYTSPDCTACYAAKLRMRRLGVDFEEVDLSADPVALAYVRDELGHQQAPVTVHINPSGQLESWSGFWMDRISQIATAQHSPAAATEPHTDGPGTGQAVEVLALGMREQHRRRSIAPDVA